MIQEKSSLAKNTFMMVILNICKIVLPFMTLPYLTRVLSTDAYGSVAYIKAVMGYMQTLVDFGFMLCATKYVASAHNNKEKIGYIVGNSIIAKLIIGFLGLIILTILTLSIDILKTNFIFVLLSYFNVIITIFLFDFLFMGLEKMDVITYRFLMMKGLSTFFTFIFVKNDSHILWIPGLDFITSLIAVIFVYLEVKKIGISIKFSKAKDAIDLIKESTVYFFSNVASLSFNVFNTIIMGAFMTKTDVAYWSICMQCITAVQTLLNPVSDAIYPEMIRTKSLQKIMKVLKIFIPLVTFACILAFYCTPLGLYIVGGEKYIPATPIFRILIPVILFGFLSIMFGWPILGAIDKVKETTKTAILSISFQVICILILVSTNTMNLYTVAIVRTLTEILLFLIRFYYYKKFKYLFAD